MVLISGICAPFYEFCCLIPIHSWENHKRSLSYSAAVGGAWHPSAEAVECDASIRATQGVCQPSQHRLLHSNPVASAYQPSCRSQGTETKVSLLTAIYAYPPKIISCSFLKHSKNACQTAWTVKKKHILEIVPLRSNTFHATSPYTIITSKTLVVLNESTWCKNMLIDYLHTKKKDMG